MSLSHLTWFSRSLIRAIRRLLATGLMERLAKSLTLWSLSETRLQRGRMSGGRVLRLFRIQARA